MRLLLQRLPLYLQAATNSFLPAARHHLCSQCHPAAPHSSAGSTARLGSALGLGLGSVLETCKPIGLDAILLSTLRYSRSYTTLTSYSRHSLRSNAVLDSDLSHQGHASGLSSFRRKMRARCFSSTDADVHCQRLSHRRVLRISGDDRVNFLQGLVTNDVSLLDNGKDNAALYAMMLNVKGRVLYDLILYRLDSDVDSILVECNAEISDDLLKIFSKFKLRKKLSITDASDKVNVWAAFSKDLDHSLTDLAHLSLGKKESVLACLPDPRLTLFGYRVLLPPSVEGASVIKNTQNVSEGYDCRRYQFGVSEGIVDLPPAECLPLESNLVFLNGVSFDKGCYVGQELTARTNYTGVIRKRLMPLVTSKDVVVKSGSTVETAAGKQCGKVRQFVGRHGLGLLRVEEVIGKGPLVIRDGTEIVCEAETHVPRWWTIGSDEVVKKTIAKGVELD